MQLLLQHSSTEGGAHAHLNSSHPYRPYLLEPLPHSLPRARRHLLSCCCSNLLYSLQSHHLQQRPGTRLKVIMLWPFLLVPNDAFQRQFLSAMRGEQVVLSWGELLASNKDEKGSRSESESESNGRR